MTAFRAAVSNNGATLADVLALRKDPPTQWTGLGLEMVEVLTTVRALALILGDDFYAFWTLEVPSLLDEYSAAVARFGSSWDVRPAQRVEYVVHLRSSARRALISLAGAHNLTNPFSDGSFPSFVVY
jgi:hypothetical protein